MEWRTRDWIWIVGILVAIIILIISMFYAENEVIEVNFSIIASAVSIALALLAIFIALNQSRDNQQLSTSLNVTMSIMNEKLSSVDEKVNKIDPDVLVKVYKDKMNEVILEVEKAVGNTSGMSTEEVEKKYRDKLDDVGREIEEIIYGMNDIQTNTIFNKTNYQIGNRVHHTKWGVGEVILVKGYRDSQELTIEFPEPTGRKHLIAKYAPVSKID